MKHYSWPILYQTDIVTASWQHNRNNTAGRLQLEAQLFNKALPRRIQYGRTRPKPNRRRLLLLLLRMLPTAPIPHPRKRTHRWLLIEETLRKMNILHLLLIRCLQQLRRGRVEEIVHQVSNIDVTHVLRDGGVHIFGAPYSRLGWCLGRSGIGVDGRRGL